MLDAALIEKCADPSLTPAIVEQFVEAAGSPDALAITVKSGGRLILVPKLKTSDEALDIVRENVGRAVVRVGLTQFPVGVGVKDASELKADIVNPCENLRMGTRMFAKIMRIVAKWYGNPAGKEVLPQIFEDAVYSWKTGEFKGASVFQAVDPGMDWKAPDLPATAESSTQEEARGDVGVQTETVVAPEGEKDDAPANPNDTDIRIDLSGIGARN